MEKLEVLRYRMSRARQDIRAIEKLPERGEKMTISDGYYKITVPDDYKNGILSLIKDYYTKEFEKWKAKFENMEV